MIKIRGIVKLAHGIRLKLQNGIPKGEVESFQYLVRRNVGLIEDICRQARTTPKSLPFPSRQAYLFLKGLDLDCLPLRRKVEAAPSPKRIRISNVIKSYELILGCISTAASNRTSGSVGQASPPVESEEQRIAQRIRDEVETIERLCANNDSSPQDLGEPSRLAYGWMKFLTLEDHLTRHIGTVSRGTDILRKVVSDCGLGSRKSFFHLAQLAGIYRRKTLHDSIIVHASEGFLDAGNEILEAIARCALVGKDRQQLQRIEEYVDSEAYGGTLFEVEAAAGRNGLNPQGRHYDLGALFEKVNSERFRGEMPRPALTWNRTFTSCKFGHYHPARDLVMLSMTLDDARVPSFVVEFVLYHEVLHKKLGVRWNGTTRRVHTQEFRQEERKFPRYKEAEAWLTRLAIDIRKGKSH